MGDGENEKPYGLARTIQTPVAASRQSAAFFATINSGALTRRRYRAVAIHAGRERSGLEDRILDFGFRVLNLFPVSDFGPRPGFVSVISSMNIGACFGFRASDFG